MQADIAYCGKIIDYRGFHGEACVNIDSSKGLIVSISKEPKADKILLDVRGRDYLISPGFIDMHVHLRGLQLSYKEDERSGSMEALRSGITLIIDMPNTIPRLDNTSALRDKLSRLNSLSWTDYGVYAAIPSMPSHVKLLAKEPIIGFKVYPQDLYRRFESVKAATLTGKLIVIHAEHENAEKAIVEDENNRRIVRGCWAEIAATLDAIELKGRIHITHVSCPQTVLYAKAAGITVDTTLHHLLGLIPPDACRGRVNPPVRSEAERMRLLSLLAEGYIDALVSDHAPHKLRDKIDPLQCSPGLASLGYWPSIAFCFVRSGLLSLEDILRLITYSPAKIMGLQKFYGMIASGMRANMVVYKVGLEGHIPAKLYSKGDNVYNHTIRSCLEVKAVIVGGALAYLDGQPLAKPATINAASLLQVSSSPHGSS
jgi:dihydroorotase